MLCQRCSESEATGSSSIVWRIVSRCTFTWHTPGAMQSSARSGDASIEPWFSNHELTVIRNLVLDNREFFLEKWNAYFGGKQ